jgi:hypothetical protein
MSEKLPNSNTLYVSIGCGYDKIGRRFKTSEGQTQDIQRTLMRRHKSTTNNLNSPVIFLRLLWAKSNSNEYTKAFEVINDCYRKMLMIGKSNEVFQDNVPDLLKAKTYQDFTLAKDNIEQRYDRYLKSGGIKLKIQIPIELFPHPTKYTHIASLPTQ